MEKPTSLDMPPNVAALILRHDVSITRRYYLKLEQQPVKGKAMEALGRAVDVEWEALGKQIDAQRSYDKLAKSMRCRRSSAGRAVDS